MRPRGEARFLEDRRRKAVNLVLRGQSAAHAAEAVGATKRSVRRWLQAYRDRGHAGLDLRAVPGRPSKLSADQQTELIRLLRRGPEANGCRFSHWEPWEIAELIQREFGVSYHPDSINDLLARSAGLHVRDLNCAAGMRG